MGDTYAIHALRRKRARLAGEIQAARNALAKKREALATIDAVLLMFEPDCNPEMIPPILPASRRSLYFRHGEKARLCVSALREAGKPVSCRYVAEYCMAAKGLDPELIVREKIIENIRSGLVALAAKGLARKIIEWPETWWELAV